MQAARSLAAPLVAVALLALVGPSVAAQQRARSRQEPPVAPHANDIEASYIRMPLPPGEERYGRLDGARMKQFVNEITRISRQSRDDGNRYWGRIAGTRYTEITARLVAERFREFGLQDGALMAEGAVTVHARLQTELRSGLTDYNVWGTLPGATTEEILVIAHSDGYFEAAFDNASGMAVMLGLAEYFSQIPQAQRRRTLKFVSTAAHHTGSPGTRWMHDNRDTVLAKAVLVLNCEHTSITETYEFGPVLRKSNSIAARRWWVHGSDKLASLVLNAYQIFGVTIFDGMEPRASGDMGAISRDLPSSQLIVSPVYYHSDHDRSDIVPDAGLEAVGRAYAKIIDEVNELEAHDLKQSGAPSGQQ